MSSYRHKEGTLLPLAGRWSLSSEPADLMQEEQVRRKVRQLADLMLEGRAFPPIKVVLWEDGRLIVQDGFHRIAASLLAGFTHIPAVNYADGVINPDPNPWNPNPWNPNPWRSP